MKGQINIFRGVDTATVTKKDKAVRGIIPEKFVSVNSLSGGKTSAYIAAHYPADHQVFSLVRIEDQRCKFPDEKVRKQIEDRIEAPFVGTAEEDTIIYTMLDLEQYLGQPIQWVTGITFDEVIASKCGWLPNKLHRYCTTHMKIIPIFEWVWSTFGHAVEMRIGYRANEVNRAATMISKLNEHGLLEIKHSLEKWTMGRHKGKNKWEYFQWQKPVFPLIQDGVFKWQIENYWTGRPVRFAAMNNCVGCFHRNPILLRKQFEWHPHKMRWFSEQEGGDNGYWRSDFSYDKISKHALNIELLPSDFSDCDSGYCEIN